MTERQEPTHREAAGAVAYALQKARQAGNTAEAQAQAGTLAILKLAATGNRNPSELRAAARQARRAER